MIARPAAIAKQPLADTVLLAAGEVEYSDADRLEAVNAFLRALYPEMELRRSDSQVPTFAFSCERGDENNNPHGQGAYDVKSTIADEARLKKNEKDWLRAIWQRATRLPSPKIEIRIVRPKDRVYVYGYIWKARAVMRQQKWPHRLRGSPKRTNRTQRGWGLPRLGRVLRRCAAAGSSAPLHHQNPRAHDRAVHHIGRGPHALHGHPWRALRRRDLARQGLLPRPRRRGGVLEQED